MDTTPSSHDGRDQLLPLALTAALALAGCSQGGQRDPASASASSPQQQDGLPVPADAGTATQALAKVGATLRDLRAAASLETVHALSGTLRSDGHHLDQALTAVAGHAGRLVDAGQLQRMQPDRQPPSLSASDLDMAVGELQDTLAELTQCGDQYRTQLHLAIATLGANPSPDRVRSLATTISDLLEDSSQLHSILADVAVASKAVRDEVRIVQSVP
jgi:hypothetical protein